MSKSDQIRALRERRYEAIPAGAIKREVDKVTGITEAVNKAGPLINNNAAHQAKWRVANLELNRQRARDGMRKRRAKNNG